MLTSVESRFSCLFPKYREQYLKSSWKFITTTLARHGIGCELDLTEGAMTVFTTLKTYDPAAILNGEWAHLEVFKNIRAVADYTI